MTIGDLLNLWQNRSIQKIDNATNKSLEGLYKQLEDVKAELWETHQQALNSKSNTSASSKDKEQAGPVKTVEITIISGPHEGSNFSLRPTSRTPAFAGRSTGKKFVQKGVSLPDDYQVSTTHGKFTIYKGAAYFTDTGSTNGTSFKGDTEELQIDERYELNDGMVLVIGISELSITLGYE